MDFQELLNHADYNAAEANYKGSVTKYSSVLPPPKKIAKSNVQSENIKRFLEKKKAEEAAKVAEARKEREKLLALRAQNSKNNKKAKIMASRTKDNDFSKIKLTEDEIEAKKRREEVLRKSLNDKVERMKARIEMEEKEKLMPKKRKRKSKNSEHVENLIQDELQNGDEELHFNPKDNDSHRPMKDRDGYRPTKDSDRNRSENYKFHKPKPPPPPPSMSFTELLKIAEKRQVDPIEIVVKKKEEQKLMTKKERKLMEEELARQKRKQERLQRENTKSKELPKHDSSQNITLSKKNSMEKEENRKPVVIHVGKDVSKSDQDAKFKIPKSSSTNKVVPAKPKDISSSVNLKSSSHSNSIGKPIKSSAVNEQKKVNKSRDEAGISPKDVEIKKKVVVPKKNVLKINSIQVPPNKQTDVGPKLDEEALKAKIEEQVREKLQREMEEKFAARFALLENKISQKMPDPPPTPTPPPPPKQVKKVPAAESNNSKKVVEKSSGIYKKDLEKMIAIRKQAMAQTNLKPKLPEKKPFHTNPYLDPPRRLLEPQRPPRPPLKRRIESDDDDEEDDMSDFIDDGPSQNDEDYSKYIKEIFGYDRDRYADDDEDDIVESSFAEQMKEEVRSAKLGYLEDLEEEKLELERMKKKKKKLKK